MQASFGAKVAALATGMAALAQPAPATALMDDTLRQNGAQSSVPTDTTPKVTAPEAVEKEIGGVKVRISASPLAVMQDQDRELLGQLAGGPSIRTNTGIAGDRKSNEFFQNGKIATWDVTNSSPRIIGSLTLRDEGVKNVVDALKKEGYVGAALAMTHGSERGVLLLQTKENGVMAIAYEIPSLKRDTPGTDAKDSAEFKRLMAGILSAMAEQCFGLTISKCDTPAAKESAKEPAAAPKPSTAVREAPTVEIVHATVQALTDAYDRNYPREFRTVLDAPLEDPKKFRPMWVTVPTRNKEREQDAKEAEAIRDEANESRSKAKNTQSVLNDRRSSLVDRELALALAGISPERIKTESFEILRAEADAVLTGLIKSLDKQSREFDKSAKEHRKVKEK